MPVIIIITLAIFCVLIIGTWHYLGNIEKTKKIVFIIIDLGNIEKTKKIVFIIIGIFVSYLITMILFSISKSGVTYPSNEIEQMVHNMIVTIFTGLNGILVLPYLGRLWDKISEEEITKQQFQKRICILLIIAIIVFILEINYLKGVQNGILEIYQKAISKG